MCIGVDAGEHLLVDSVEEELDRHRRGLLCHPRPRASVQSDPMTHARARERTPVSVWELVQEAIETDSTGTTCATVPGPGR